MSLPKDLGHTREGNMDKFGKSQPVKRVEDVRFLNGTGRYVDDIAPEGALRGYVFRSSVAHLSLIHI